MTKPLNPTFKALIEEVRPMAGEVVLLYGDTLARFYGVAHGEYDFYYIVQELNGKGVYWASAAGGLVSIKDRLGDDYLTIDKNHTRNGAPSRPFQVVVEDECGRKTFVEGGSDHERFSSTRSRLLTNMARWDQEHGLL